MPATYTYNDAIEDAERELVQAWAATGGEVDMLPLVLNAIGRFDALKRRSRRKRSAVQEPADQLVHPPAKQAGD
jgi:hypothetical protein